MIGRMARTTALLVVAAVALLWSLGVVASADPPQTLGLVAGLALIAAGLLLVSQAQMWRAAVLAMLLSLTWFAPAWVADQDAAPWLRSVGEILSPLALALVVDLAVTAMPGRGRPERVLQLAAYAIGGTVAVARAVLRDPLLDLYCRSNCTDNVFLVDPHPDLVRTLGDLWLWSAPVIALGLTALSARTVARSTPAARRALVPVLAPAALVALAEAASAVALLISPLEEQQALFTVRAAAHCALALGLAWSIARVWLTRLRVGRLAEELGEAPPPGRLRHGLAAALGDAGIEVLYVRSASAELIDAEGRPKPPPEQDRGVARITHRGRTVALVLHDPALVHARDLERALGSAARLAIENEALRAEALAQLRELRASRTRVVEAGDAERRRLERNLHDGAQQRLLALSYDLRVARARATPAAAAQLDAARADVEAALEELREIAHGIYPAILTEGGLALALETLADTAPLPVELTSLVETREQPAVETTAYVAVAEAIEDAHRRGAESVSARVAREDDHVVVTAEDDGAPRHEPLLTLADRLGALGGSLALGTRTLRAEIPCA
jgi:signal transduction histidine kinase